MNNIDELIGMIRSGYYKAQDFLIREPTPCAATMAKNFLPSPTGYLPFPTATYICTQWGISNITNFGIRAKALGYEIKELK